MSQRSSLTRPASSSPTRRSSPRARHHLKEAGMPKNILVFADGTGNEGGLLPDESRTNV
jgi:hypothetical protein